MNNSERPVAIDLFSGAGGLSLGFEQAGFDVVGAVELDPIHAAIHKFNFPECTILPESVEGLSGAKIRQTAGLGNRRVHVVMGGAPCQGFSLIGQRALDDPRNSLVREFVRIVGELKASYFVFENVKGLTIGKHTKVLNELVEEFDAIGYRVRLPWRVLNTYSYGIPQDRERLFVIGARKGLRLPDYPEAITRPAGSAPDLLELPEGPSCYDALHDLPDADNYEVLFTDDTVQTSKWGQPSPYAARLRCLRASDWGKGYRREWEPSTLTASARTRHSEISRRRFSETPPGSVEPISRFFKLPAYGVSNTLRAGTDSARGAFTSPRPIHYERPRCITVREMARLHGFPDWFRFHPTKWHGARQIGNAVPPPLAYAIGQKMVKTLEIRPVRPRRKLHLGDPALLQLDMTAAADYWGVSNPIARRNRKSGVKKRKQEEIERERLVQLGGTIYG